MKSLGKQFEDQRTRIGFIRIPKPLWDANEDAIKKCLEADSTIMNTLQSVQNGSYLQSVDCILINPEFDEVPGDNLGELQRYECTFYRDADGSITRSAMSKVE
jgi:hypothetical protein